ERLDAEHGGVEFDAGIEAGFGTRLDAGHSGAVHPDVFDYLVRHTFDHPVMPIGERRGARPSIVGLSLSRIPMTRTTHHELPSAIRPARATCRAAARTSLVASSRHVGSECR